MRIDVDIEELEIRGVEPQFGYRIGQAFERELTRLLGKHGLAALDVRTKVIDQIEAGSVTGHQDQRRTRSVERQLKPCME